MQRFFSNQSFLGRFSQYFGASMLQAVISIGGIPLTTRRLDPDAFGAFAVVGAVVGVFTLIAEMGATVVLTSNLKRVPPEEQRALLSTVIFSCGAAGLACSVVMLLAWPEIAAVIGGLAVPTPAFVLAAASIVPTAMWSCIYTYCVVSGRASQGSALVVLASVVSFTVTITALYAFDLGLVSLFLGALSAQTAVTLVGMVAIRAEVAPVIKPRWVIEILRVAPSSIMAGVLNGAQPVVERSLLSTHVGLSTLGLYTHSQQYGAFLAKPIKALANAVWPVALDDAADRRGEFERLGRAWRPVYVGLSCVGLFLAFFSAEIVTVLTHGKFTAAAPLVPIWVAYILVQNAGKPATATLYALGSGHLVARIQTATSLMAMVLLAIAVSLLSVWGAILALFLSMLAFRILVGLFAIRLRPIPFQDAWVAGGCLAIMGATLLNHTVSLTSPSKLLLCFAAIGGCLFFAREQISDMRTYLLGAPPAS